MCVFIESWFNDLQLWDYRIINKSIVAIIMHPAQASEARLGGVHFIFRHIQIPTRLLQVELFRGYYVYCMHI